MARAYGSSAHLLMKRETTYGQAATGDYIRMPFNRCNLGSEQGLIDDPVLGQGRDPLAPLQDVINDEGDIVETHNQNPKRFVWKADPKAIIAAAKRGYQALDSIH